MLNLTTFLLRLNKHTTRARIGLFLWFIKSSTDCLAPSIEDWKLFDKTLQSPRWKHLKFLPLRRDIVAETPETEFVWGDSYESVTYDAEAAVDWRNFLRSHLPLTYQRGVISYFRGLDPDDYARM